MSMTRNDALSQIAKTPKFNKVTAQHVLNADAIPKSFRNALDAKDIEFFTENASAPASVVALGCMKDRTFPPKIQPPTPLEIKQFRHDHDLTQTNFALLIGSTLRTVQDWEAGLAKMHSGLWELIHLKLG